MTEWRAGRLTFVGMFTVFVLLGGFGYWATFSNISGAIVASGQIEVDRNRQVVQHLDGGVVEPLHRTKVASSAGE